MGRECASQGWGPGVPAPSPRLRDPPAALSACREVAAQGLEALPSAPMTMGWRRPCQGALRVHSERPGPACGQTGPEPSSPLLRTDCPWGLPSPHPPPQAPSDFLSSAQLMGCGAGTGAQIYQSLDHFIAFWCLCFHISVKPLWESRLHQLCLGQPSKMGWVHALARVLENLTDGS